MPIGGLLIKPTLPIKLDIGESVVIVIRTEVTLANDNQSIRDLICTFLGAGHVQSQLFMLFRLLLEL